MFLDRNTVFDKSDFYKVVSIDHNKCYNYDMEWISHHHLPLLNLTAGKTVMFGTIPVKLQLEINYYVQQPDAFGPEQHSVQTCSCPEFFLGDIFFLCSDIRLQ